ncbi:uroporphyrinogen decarboxylase family protein [Anaerolineales bacterium HSG6]|nr:uroporphyrinogen decarboxylase family protein [Anaerolineales bacterium HSG6]MDM8530789.1 uroporphyrinogen decarboxylase family protein [Anaerolineales bacterium HSG25]
MNKRDRVYAALEGLPVDRVPISLWRHFYKQEQTATGLASATLAFYKRYDFDLIKLTPSSFYAIEDWGARISFSQDDTQPSILKQPLIQRSQDWRNLTTLRGTEGCYGEMLHAIKLVKNQLAEDDAPFLMTVFTPLTIAYQLAGKNLIKHLHDTPTDVHIGLATIAETISRFARAVIDAGADGIFFVSQTASTTQFDAEDYQTYGVRYDLIALERVKAEPVPLVLHLEGSNIDFKVANQYPVHAVSWQHSGHNSSIEEALILTNKTLMTGLNSSILEQGSSAEIFTQIRHATKKTGGQRLILAPTNVLSPQTPDENLRAIMHLV